MTLAAAAPDAMLQRFLRERSSAGATSSLYLFPRPTARRRSFAAFGRPVAVFFSVGAAAGADVRGRIVALSSRRKDARISEESFRR
jgi:hypothetical protein